VTDEHYPHFVYAKLWEAIQPLDRGERYEDPLEASLKASALGAVTGGGSSFDREHGIDYVGVDIDLASLDSLDVVKRALEEAGAPKGSELQYDCNGEPQVMPFGVTERVTIWLDGVSLPDDVYQRFSSDDLADQLEKAMAFDSSAEIRGSWQGPKETSIYIHGADAEKLYNAIEPILLANPACQNARVVVRDGSPALSPREVRLPTWGTAPQ
jgi:hypothetical protein